MRWMDKVGSLTRAMEDIEDPRAAELRDCRDRLRRLEAQQTVQPLKPGIGSR